jgi:hypothetical protein
MVRLFHCLTETRNDPDRAASVGASWWPPSAFNSRTICVNAKILGAYLSIKPNSVNKNLMSAGWEQTQQRPGLADENGVQQLPDCKDWRLRESQYDLSSESTLAAFSSVRCTEPNSPSGCVISSMNPPPSEACELRVFLELLQDKPQPWIEKFFQKAGVIWFRAATKIEDACRISRLSPLLNHEAGRILALFSNGQLDLHYHDFLRFLMWFGFRTATTHLILQCMDDPMSSVKCIMCPISQAAMKQIRAIGFTGWMLALAETPGDFLIFSVGMELRVAFDPLAETSLVGEAEFDTLKEVVTTYCTSLNFRESSEFEFAKLEPTLPQSHTLELLPEMDFFIA